MRSDIREFVANISYLTLVELQTSARRREIELETWEREERETVMRDRRPVQSQSTTKQPKPTESRDGGQKGRTYRKCVKGYEGPYRLGTICYMCGKEGIWRRIALIDLGFASVASR